MRTMNKFLIIFLILFISTSFFNSVNAASDQPKVLFDESGPYAKFYTIYNTGASGDSVFANLLQSNGFSVSKMTDKPITYDKIKGYDVIVLMGTYRNYTDAEVNALNQYVANGGGLFLVGDPWGNEDGDANFGVNKITRSFGVYFANNIIVVDQKQNLLLENFIKVTDITPSPVTSNLSVLYFMQSTYLVSTGNSTVLANSSPDSWADNLDLTSAGYSQNNQQKEAGEVTGPLPLLSSLEYGKGKVVFTSSAASFTNFYIYRSNSWKLGLNSMNWLANQPIPSSYKTAGPFSLTLGDTAYRVVGTALLAIIILLGLFLAFKKENKWEDSRVIKTIKNWKYIALMVINIIFAIIGMVLFFPINFLLFDPTQFMLYDPNFGYALLLTGVVFLVITSIILFNLVFRQRILTRYHLADMALILFFSGFTIIMGALFSFPMMEVFTLGSLILLIPFIINLWVVRGHGADIIVEGKEFNRLAKLSVKSLPYELHGLYTDAVYLGEGGFGRVYKAKRVDTEKEVAIKIPKSFDKRAEKTFITEVSNWSQLNHPHIVQLYNYKILPIPYIETELCDGTLPHGQKSLNDAVNIIYDIALGLGYAHHKNIIHGDVKTSNLMVCGGLYKISDWGLSKLKTGESVTLSGATPQYAAPEQISQEFGKADERTDIYQLGTVFYELVTGKVPFEGEMSEIYGSILNKEPLLPSQINPQSRELEPIIMKCLNKVKDERYSSMEELLKDLEDYRQPGDDTVIMPQEK